MTIEVDVTETLVIFRRWPKKKGGDVLALFPLDPEHERGHCSSFVHVGQHGIASYSGCIRITTPASVIDPDVSALKRELEGIGYRLRVVERAPHWSKIEKARKDAGL